MSSSSENLDLPTLHKQLKDAVDGDRRALCAGLGRVHHRRGAFSPYEGGYLTREHLADLVQRKILESASWNSVETWTAEDIFAWLNPLKRDKRLPDRIQDRQLFLESLYRVMADCFQSAGERMSGRRPAEYLNYLGAEPLYIDLPELDFNPADVGFYEITRWNANRVLDEHDNVGEVRRLRRTAQNWVPDEMIERYQEMVLGESGGKGSQCSSLVGFDLDTREDQGSQLIITVTGGWYYQNVVIRDIMRDHRDIYDTLASRITNADGGSLHGGLAAVIAGAPNSNIALNITVSSRSGKVLLIKRTAGVRTWQEYFQVGPHETMNFRPTETKQENCFVLARRALSEELQIEKGGPGRRYHLLLVWVLSAGGAGLFLRTRADRPQRERDRQADPRRAQLL
ncbi:hypothetical protein [Frankia sp. ArI3]|uniref:hypothetical protein n=1 Tax=Frankia sp. ArI3 TaxID=1858 RepID=UPI001C6FCB21|nr:hypothetical protein [Frankia sp. ArI3]